MAKKHGRPTTYSEEMLTKAREYLDSCTDEEIERDTDRGTQYRLRVRLPTIERMAVTLGVSRDTLYEWAKHHPSFSDTLEELRAEQADRLITEGLAGNYNPTIAKLVLSANHGMREKSDVTTDGQALPVPILATPNVRTHNSNETSTEPDEED